MNENILEITKEKIIENINNPQTLEELYHSNKKVFSETIFTMYNENPVLIIEYWYVRIFYKPLEKNRDLKKYIFTAILIILAWIPVRLFIDWPFGNDTKHTEEYLLRIIPIMFSITLSFFLLGSIRPKKLILCIVPNIIMFCYLLLLPIEYNVLVGNNSQAISNAYIFTFVLLWFFILFSQSNYNFKNPDYNSFLVKCGEIIIWSTILIIGLSVISLLLGTLFDAIKIEAWNFIFTDVLSFGIVAFPFISLLIYENNKIKLSTITANIFLPLILISLVVFGVISLFSVIKPYEDRNIFVVYNVMMVIVICALVFTSINENKNRIINICSYILPVVSIILDAVTISAVIYRLKEYGVTANKITLLGINLIMLGHLIFMAYLKIRYNKIERNVIYIPAYFIWAFIVVFIFPFVLK